MGNLKLYLSMVLFAGLTSFCVSAQQPSTGASDAGSLQASTAGPMPISLQTAAQDSHGDANSSGKASQRAIPVQSTAGAPEIHNPALRPVEGELAGKLDSNTAKVGDAVVVKTTEKATTANGVVIPSGSKIVGQVVDAQPATGATQTAKVTVLFDRAQLNSGRTVPIRGVLQSVAPPQAGESATGLIGGEAAAPASRENPGSGSAASGAGAGASTLAATQQGAHTASSAASPAHGGTAPGTVVSQQGDVAIKTTAVPGVLLATDADGRPFSNASGALLASQHNIQLDSGTHVVLAVAAEVNKPGSSR